MDDLETRLRDGLARAAADAPARPALADQVVTRGRRVHRVRLAAVGAAAATVLVLAAGALAPGLIRHDTTPPAERPPTGAPTVPLHVGQNSPRVLGWPRPGVTQMLGDDTLPVAVVPAGLLVRQPGRLRLLPGDGSAARVLVAGDTSQVAVSADGRRLALVLTGQRLVEVDIATGERVRDERIDPRVVPAGADLYAVAYSGDSLLLAVKDGTVLVEPGPGMPMSRLDGYGRPLGGGPAPDRAGGPGGYGAFDVPGTDRCRVTVARLTTGGKGWQLCRESFSGFSPAGSYVLSTDALDENVLVRDVRNGDQVRRFEAPDPVRALGWETDDVVLFTALDGDRTVVRRCVVSTGDCSDAASFADTYEIPDPLPRFGG